MTEITYKAVVSNIESVTDFVNKQLEKLDCSMKVQIQLDVAIDEIFGNICRYAYEGEGEATVAFDYDEAGETVSLTFSDSGVPFNPLEKEAPDVSLGAEEREIGGLGIYMVRKSMDDVKYEYRGAKNIFTIYKKIR